MDSQARQETGAQYILRQLTLFGITHFFMVPGKLINAFMKCYPKGDASIEGIRPVVTACESGSAYMAEGYARASENFGVCLVIGGPGATNTLTGIASAYTDNYPVLLLSGQIASTLEMQNVLQDSSQTGVNLCDVFKPVTRSALEVKAGQPLPTFLRETLRRMNGVERGPVYLALSKEVLYSSEASRPDIRDSVVDTWGNKAIALNKISNPVFQTFMAQAKNVIILVGLRGKNAKTADALIKISEKYNLPVATTLSAKGIFPEDHPNALGIYGYSGNPRAINAFKDMRLDGVILLGLDTTQWSTMLWSHELKPRLGAIQVDTNPDYLGQYLGITSGIVADSSEFLHHVSAHYEAALELGSPQRSEWLQKLCETPRHYPIDTSATGNIEDHPAAYVSILQEHFPADGIVSVDSGSHRSFFGHYWCAKTPQSYMSATTLGPMGWSIPAGIGASFAQPDKKCMVVTGDGCMLMQGLELATASKYSRNVLFIVFNNHSYSASYFNNRENLEDLTAIPDYDWCLFANSLGVDSTCVTTPQALANCIQQVMSLSVPHLLEIKCDPRHMTPNQEYGNRIKDYPLL